MPLASACAAVTKCRLALQTEELLERLTAHCIHGLFVRGGVHDSAALGPRWNFDVEGVEHLVQQPAIPIPRDHGEAAGGSDLEGGLIRAPMPQAHLRVVETLDVQYLAHQFITTHFLEPQQDDSSVEGILETESHIRRSCVHLLLTIIPLYFAIIVGPRCCHHGLDAACLQQLKHRCLNTDVIIQVKHLFDAELQKDDIGKKAKVVRPVIN
mmetsp:Transcript_103185/g.291363  ORF Transcript_103185/g.291363 Transcript_103185/m.291363 type:complete len:211 (-) Transcript_103185:678-1310(-)